MYFVLRLRDLSTFTSPRSPFINYWPLGSVTPEKSKGKAKLGIPDVPGRREQARPNRIFDFPNNQAATVGLLRGKEVKDCVYDITYGVPPPSVPWPKNIFLPSEIRHRGAILMVCYVSGKCELTVPRTSVTLSSASQDRIFPLSIASQEQGSSATANREVSVCDEVLIASLPKNNRNLDILFYRFSRLVFSIGLRILHDAGEAEELVQEVFMCLYQKAHMFDPKKGSGKTWIVQMAYHRAFDRRTYLVRRHFYAGTDLEKIHDTLTGDIDLEREIGLKLTHEQMQRAFVGLSEKQRKTLELFFFEGLDFDEIAQHLHEPLGNVRHHYYRGLEKLRKSALVGKLKNG